MHDDARFLSFGKRHTCRGYLPSLKMPFSITLRQSSFCQPMCDVLRVETDPFHHAHVPQKDTGKLIHRRTPKEHCEEREWDTLHRRSQYPLSHGSLYVLGCLPHTDVFEEHKKLIQQTSVAQFKHLLNFFACIEPLCSPRLISLRQPPVQALLCHTHRAFFCLLVVPHLLCPFFPRLPPSSPTGTLPESSLKTSVLLMQ